MNQSYSESYRLESTKCDAQHGILFKQIKLAEGNFYLSFSKKH
ncbi:hypothetical protein bcere0028_52060 [Bacillus cereus AH1271]|nr:hypothetical protein bcere0028_52060 [Bacillus cereus AH1271]KYQ03757.1 hypothetical protein B4079_1074 [Bacillus cereus]